MSIKTTVGALSDPARVKAVTDLPKGFFSRGHMSVHHLDVPRCGALGEYFQVWEIRADLLEFDPTESSEHIPSLIGRIFWLQILF